MGLVAASRRAADRLLHVASATEREPVAGALPEVGVNLVGFHEGEEGQGETVRLGLGDVARRLARGLERAGIPYVEIPYRPARGAAPDFAAARHEVNVLCLNADYVPAFAADAGPSFFAGRYSIGVWFWETNLFRARDLESLRYLDEVWVASEYVRRAIRAARPEAPVHVVPIPVEPPPAPSVTRADLGLPAGFTFLFVFNWVSAQRKNPTGVLQAFLRAFEPGEGPILVLKSVNGAERKPERLEELRELAADRPDVVVLDGFVSDEQRNGFLAACDCYVSLHRSEGFGLTLVEAMSYGKPVVATAYSANVDYTDDGSGYLVPFRLVPVPEDWWAHARDAEWAEPDVEAAARALREVYERQDEARERGERGREAILDRLSLDRTAAFLTERLAAAEDHLRAREERSAFDARTPILEASVRLSKGPGASLERHARGGPKGLIRGLLLRALWPQLAYQHRVDSALAEALTRLQRSQEELSEELVRFRPANDRTVDEPGGDRS